MGARIANEINLHGRASRDLVKFGSFGVHRTPPVITTLKDLQKTPRAHSTEPKNSFVRHIQKLLSMTGRAYL